MDNNLFLKDTINADEFERKRTAVGLFNVVRSLSSSSPLVVGVHGNWGSGKTDFLKTIRTKAESLKGQFKTVWFEPWRYERREDVGSALIQAILNGAEVDQDQLDKHLKLKQRAGRIFRGTANAAAEMKVGLPGGFNAGDVKTLITAFKDGYDDAEFDYVNEVDTLISDIDSAISGWVGDDRLVLFIDDLDRCLPDQMIRALEAVHLYLASLPIIAFIALDSGAFESAVEARYGSIDGAAYIDKVVDIAFDLPAPSTQQLTTRYHSRLEALELKSSNIRKILQVGFGSNPRTYERFINRMIGLSAAHTNLEIFKLDQYVEILATLIVVQMKFPDLLQTILRNPLGFAKFVNESDATDPNPIRMREQSAVEFTKYFDGNAMEWDYFHEVRDAALNIFRNAGYLDLRGRT